MLHRLLVQRQQPVQLGAHGIEPRLELGEIDSRGQGAPAARRVLDRRLIAITQRAEALDHGRFARLGDVPGRAVEVSIETGPVLGQLGPGPCGLSEQEEERRRVLPLQAFLHLLGGDDRLVVVADDPARCATHVAQPPRAPAAEQRQRDDEDQQRGDEHGPDAHDSSCARRRPATHLPLATPNGFLSLSG